MSRKLYARIVLVALFITCLSNVRASFPPAVNAAGAASTADAGAAMPLVGGLSFKLPSTYEFESAPASALAGDFNGDSVPDVAVTLPDSNKVAVRLGNGVGALGPASLFPAGNKPWLIVTGDFNSDSERDLIVSNEGFNTISLLLGDGAGNFALSGSIATHGSLRIYVDDINGDGNLDLMLSSYQSYRVIMMLGDGKGNFAPWNLAGVTLDGNESHAELGDFNRDGKKDLLIQNSFYNTLSIRHGDGAGNFSARVAVAGSQYYSLEVGDFNGDGWSDFASASVNLGALVIHLNNGAGAFTQAYTYPSAFGYELWSGDLNYDGKIDLIVGSKPNILLGNGDGSFTYSSQALLGSRAGYATFGDFNGDGFADLVGLNAATQYQPTHLSLALSEGDGRFAAPAFGSVDSVSMVVTADFNNDGRLDFATSNPSTASVRIKLQDEKGNFLPAPTPFYFVAAGLNQGPGALAAGDFNNDGKMDLAATDAQATRIAILLGDGAGNFALSHFNLNFTTNRSPNFIRSANFNNDGNLDLIVLNRASNNYTVLLGDGAGNFSNVTGSTTGLSQGPDSVAVGDFNGDGFNDIAIGLYFNASVLVRFGLGNGAFNFGISSFFGVSPYPYMVKAADLNNDGKLDLALVCGSSDGHMNVLLGQGNGSFNPVVGYQMTGSVRDLAIADFDLDGHKDIIAVGNGMHSFFKGNGNGSFAAASTFLASPGAAISVDAADFNGDGKPDLVIADQTGAVVPVLLNNTRVGPGLSLGDVSVSEGVAEAELSVNLSAQSAQTVTVNYHVAPRSATAGADYQAISGQLVFAPGTLTQAIRVPIAADTLDENDEAFNVFLENSVNAEIEDAQGVGTILDDDMEPTLTTTGPNIIEGDAGAPYMVFNLSLSAASGRKTKVRFITGDGTAMAGADYLSTEGTVFFLSGETAKTVRVPIIADTLVEPDETFSLNLSSQTFLNLGNAQAQATILNDDFGGTIQFEATAYSFNEADNVAVISVTRTGGNASGISVSYNTSDGTARAGEDYQPASGTLSFGAGESSKTFSIPLLNDALNEEAQETVLLTLSNISGGAAPGSITAAVLHILDNDGNRVIGDFDGDGKTDLSVFRPSNNYWYINQSSNGVFLPHPFGATGDSIVPADYDGDGKTDIAVFRAAEGHWHILDSSASAYRAVTFGQNGDLPSPGDYDADGKADVAVFRPASGFFYLLRSSDGAFDYRQWGTSGDLPLVGDYDGDGQSDFAVFRPSTSSFYVLRSSDASVLGQQFGASGDRPVAADFDGDGKTDISVYRPSAGGWYYLQSSDNGFRGISWGTTEDMPSAGDYDGDGKWDVAVFRPSTGTFYILQSTTNSLRAEQFGTSGDVPIPSAFIR